MLVTLAFALLMLIPIIVLVFLQTSSGSEELAIDQAQQSVSRLKNVVDVVGAQGPPAKATLNIIIPERVSRITIGSVAEPPIGKEIVFAVRTRGGDSEVVAVTLYAVAGNLTNYTKAGVYPVTVESVDDCLGTGNPCVYVRPT